MDFKEATDVLFDRVTHDELAAEMGVSVAAIRQARLGDTAQAHRNAPEGWEKAVKRLAERQARRYRLLAEKLDRVR